MCALNVGAGAGDTYIYDHHAGYRLLGIVLSVRSIFDKTVAQLREFPGDSQARGRRKVRWNRRYWRFFKCVVRAGCVCSVLPATRTFTHPCAPRSPHPHSAWPTTLQRTCEDRDEHEVTVGLSGPAEGGGLENLTTPSRPQQTYHLMLAHKPNSIKISTAKWMLLVTARRPKSTRNRQMNARSRTSLKVGLVKLDPGVNMWSIAGIPVRRCCPGGPLGGIEASGIEEAVQEKVQPVLSTSREMKLQIRIIDIA